MTIAKISCLPKFIVPWDLQSWKLNGNTLINSRCTMGQKCPGSELINFCINVLLPAPAAPMLHIKLIFNH